MTEVIGNYIKGTQITNTQGNYQDVFNPATGSVSAQVCMSTTEEVDQAVSVATEAARDWGRTPSPKRAQVMFRFKRLLEENSDKLARIISSEHGKTHDDAMGEVVRGLEVVEFACGIPQLIKGTFSEQVADGIDVYSFPQPLGVVAGITPFNFPAMVPMWMYPNALVCGNSFVLKPSERDPSASLFMAELLKQAGLPDGVFNVVQGGKEAVDAILDHPGISAVSFVGSTPIAKYIYTRATSTGKRVQALGGAKNHMVVLPDADMQQVTDALMGSAFGSAGERCMAISVVVAIDSVADSLKDKLLDKAKALKIGPGQNSENDMGPLITAEHKSKVMDYIQQGQDSGADLLLDGREHPITSQDKGFFLGPTLFDHVKSDMSIYLDEIFGPVLVILRVKDFSEAMELANQHQFGNGVALFTSKGSAAREFVNSVQVGMVGINVAIPVPLSFYSFGGWKDSIYGASNIYGMDGVRFYTRTKTVTTRWPDIDEDQDISLAMPTVD